MASNTNGNLTIFGQETEFDGVLDFTDNLVITGKFPRNNQGYGRS